MAQLRRWSNEQDPLFFIACQIPRCTHSIYLRFRHASFLRSWSIWWAPFRRLTFFLRILSVKPTLIASRRFNKPGTDSNCSSKSTETSLRSGHCCSWDFWVPFLTKSFSFSNRQIRNKRRVSRFMLRSSAIIVAVNLRSIRSLLFGIYKKLP